MKKVTIFLLLVIIITGIVFAQRARDHLAQGREHLQAKRFDEAIASFQEVLRLEPRNRDAPALLQQARAGRIDQLITRGKELAGQGKFPDAIEVYNLVFKYQEGHKEATSLIIQAQNGIIRQLISQGQALAGQGNFDEAIEIYDKALTLSTTDRTLINNINNSKTEAQRRQQYAIQQAQKKAAIEAVEKGNALIKEKKWTEAIAEYENAINSNGLDHNQPEFAQNTIYQLQGLIEKIAAYDRPLRDDDFEVSQTPNNTAKITGYKPSENVKLEMVNPDNYYHPIISESLQIGIFDVVIPERIYGRPVEIIAAGAFAYKGLSSVTIPNSVTILEGSTYVDSNSYGSTGAFSRNNLTKVILGNGLVTIGDGSFSWNRSLKEIIIPNTVTTIGINAFNGCGLTSVTIGRDVHSIGRSAFSGNKLTGITFPAGIKLIDNLAFQNNQIQSVTFPNGIERINQGAFLDNPLTEVVIPASVMIGDGDNWSYNRDVFPLTLTRVILPANLDDYYLVTFEENLVNIYTGGGRAAGTYVKEGPFWSRQ